MSHGPDSWSVDTLLGSGLIQFLKTNQGHSCTLLAGSGRYFDDCLSLHHLCLVIYTNSHLMWSMKCAWWKETKNFTPVESCGIFGAPVNSGAISISSLNIISTRSMIIHAWGTVWDLVLSDSCSTHMLFPVTLLSSASHPAVFIPRTTATVKILPQSG